MENVEDVNWDNTSTSCMKQAGNLPYCLTTHPFIIVFILEIIDEFWDNEKDMVMPEHKKWLLKAKIAVALHDEWGRVPKTEEIEQVFFRPKWWIRC